MENSLSQQPTRPQAPKVLPVLAGLALLAFFAGLYQVTRNPGVDQPDSALLGKPAPLFSLDRIEPQAQGQKLELAELLKFGKPIVLNMWASWCVACIDEADDFEAFWQKHQSRALMVGIALNDKPELAYQFASEYQQTYPMAYDQNGKTGIDFGVLGVPETFLIDKNGIVRRRFIGAVTLQQLEAALLALEQQAGQGA